MGCCASSSSGNVPVDVPELRRRLSLGVDVEETPDVEAEENPLVIELDRARLQELTADGRSWSIGSETDQDLHRRASFSQKTVRAFGGQLIDAGKQGIGYACKKGMKPEAPNQDSFAVVQVGDQYSIYGVFDGHGSRGHDVSNFVKDQLPKLLVVQQDTLKSQPLEALRRAFRQMQVLIEQATSLHKINAEKSGTTASIILHEHTKNALHIAHVGDSRCVVARYNVDMGQHVALDLTKDHKPNDPNERARIEANGGCVIFDGYYNHRVYAKHTYKGKRYPGLNMSRSLGDLLGYYDAGLSSDPDLKTHMLLRSRPAEEVDDGQLDQGGSGGGEPDEELVHHQSLNSEATDPDITTVRLDPTEDMFMLLCSDGVWEFLSSQKAVDICSKYQATQAMKAADTLSKAAWDAWVNAMGGAVVDDITALVVYLTIDRPKRDISQ